MIIRGYFNLDYYGPFASGKEKWETWRTKEAQKKKQLEKEDAKRKHTQDLKSKIDAQKERDSTANEAIDVDPELLNIVGQFCHWKWKGPNGRFLFQERWLVLRIKSMLQNSR